MLTIGRIPYLNLYPIFYMLDRLAQDGQYRYVEGVPSYLNAQLRSGAIDVSPSSSIEHLRNPGRYLVIPGHSISSFGAIRSIFLFSRVPIEELGDRTVLTTSQSETSVALLEIVFRKFHGIAPELRTSSEPLEQAMRSCGAYLLIGDDALSREQVLDYRIYDLGDLWYRATGLPFVFALWLARAEAAGEQAALFSRFSKDLDRARDEALKNLDVIAQASSFLPGADTERLVSYWQGISYDFGDRHRQGLDLFASYCRELGIIAG